MNKHLDQACKSPQNRIESRVMSIFVEADRCRGDELRSLTEEDMPIAWSDGLYNGGNHDT